MNERSASKIAHRASWKLKTVVAIVGASFVTFILFAHPFLALDEPVAADTMIVEGWVPDYVLAAAARAFKTGHYHHVFISGLNYEPSDRNIAEGSDAAQSGRRLVALGVDPGVVVPCPGAPVSFNRTSHMARTVRDRIHALGLHPAGINVFTLGPHGRQSQLAYQRMLGPQIAVGIVSIPKNDYDPAYWWASSAGIKKTTKDFAGWLKEVIFGLRS